MERWNEVMEVVMQSPSDNGLTGRVVKLCWTTILEGVIAGLITSLIVRWVAK